MNNKIKLNGIITRINDIQTASNGKSFLHFDIALSKGTYILVKVYQEGLEKYKDIIKKGQKIELEGYLNSYINNNNTKITYVSLSTLKELANDKELFYTDEQGNEYWHGKKITKQEATPEEIAELEEMLKPFNDEVEHGL